MKRLILIGSILIVASILALSATAQNGSYARVTTTTLNVRSGPGLAYGVVAVARRGNAFVVTGESSYGNWLMIDTGAGQAGWVFAGLVDLINANGVPVVQTGTLTTGTAGQGGGGLVYGTGGPTYTASTTNVISAGQGGGFAAPTTTTRQSPFGQMQAFQPQASGFTTYVRTEPIVLVNLNMRIGPSTAYRYIWRIPGGETLTVLGRNATGTWYLANHAGHEGWVSARYVLLPRGQTVASVAVVG